MAITKANLFEPTQKRTAELMKALGHPARIAIIELLTERETCICGDITDELPLAQSTVSQHLKALKTAGIIKGEIDGVRTCYCLNEEGVKEINELFMPLIKNLTNATEGECC
ncbi:MAG: metalloregulator ArsR/SmtB family transcription factor [Balneolaceae bacterium]|nr:metalloregulator ArsR/SmtB family transcription factor [Balneolaceae bacterium]